MAVPYFNQLPPGRATFDVEQSETSIRDHIESMRDTVRASRRTIADAQKVIATANEVLARGLSDAHYRTYCQGWAVRPARS